MLLLRNTVPVLTEAAKPLLPRNHAASVAINTVTLASIRLGESPLSKQSTTPHPTNDAGFKNDGMQVVDVSNNDDDDKASSAAPPPLLPPLKAGAKLSSQTCTWINGSAGHASEQQILMTLSYA